MDKYIYTDNWPVCTLKYFNDVHKIQAGMGMGSLIGQSWLFIYRESV